MSTNKSLSDKRPSFEDGQILKADNLRKMVDYAEDYAEECAGAVESALDERLDTVETQLGIGDNTSGATLASKVKNLEDNSALKTDVQAAEAKITELRGEVFGNTDGTTTEGALVNIVATKEELNDANSEITELNKQVFGSPDGGSVVGNALTSRVGTLEGDVGTLKTSVGTLGATTSSLETSFNNLSSTIIKSIGEYNEITDQTVKEKVIFIIGSEADTEVELLPHQIYFRYVITGSTEPTETT